MNNQANDHFAQSFKTKAKKEDHLVQLLYKYKSKTESTDYKVELEENEYNAYDATITKGDKVDHIVEVKVRENYNYSQIEGWGGSFLELTKIDGIIKEQMNRGIKTPIHYINFYKDKVVTYELLPDINNYKWEIKNLQKNDHYKNPTYKHVTKLTTDLIIFNKDRKNK